MRPTLDPHVAHVSLFERAGLSDRLADGVSAFLLLGVLTVLFVAAFLIARFLGEMRHRAEMTETLGYDPWKAQKQHEAPTDTENVSDDAADSTD